MTPEELKKEAERIYDSTRRDSVSAKISTILNALRALHDRAYALGFDRAIEKAAGVASRHAKESRAIKAYEGETEALHIRDEICALKSKGE